ncbi:MAG: DUF4382 domain-containing protein [Candidatus Cyclobacteriaceae bacterium M2_1C_046]
MKKLLGLFFASIVLLTACNDEETGVKQFNIRLTDAPGDYDAVYIDLQGVQVHAETEDGDESWIDLNTNTGIYNLLDLTNGVDTLIVNDQAVVGEVSQIRLILGENNSVVIDGVEHDLKTPSAQQSGLKLNVHESLLDGITYNILLDFNAAQSVVKAGASGMYILKPVIRTIVEAENGAIEGVVLPTEITPAVMAIQNGDTLTTYANEDGYYKIIAVPGGTWDVVFQEDGYQTETVEDIEVIIGQITRLDTVNLIQ